MKCVYYREHKHLLKKKDNECIIGMRHHPACGTGSRNCDYYKASKIILNFPIQNRLTEN